jgi:hypothetical protein
MLKTMTLLALVMLTSAAPAEETTDNARSLSWISRYSRTPTLTAEWKQSDQGNFKATVKAEETAPGQATWTVELEPRYWHSTFEPLKTESGEVCVALNWHLHQDEIGTPPPGTTRTPGNCGSTGGHVDTALACGGASEYRKTSCTGFSADYLKSYGEDVTNDEHVITYPRRCKGDAGQSIFKTEKGEFTTVGQAGCEYGDMSGKIGKIPNKVGSKTFPIDKHILPLSNYAENSVVFHCCTKKEIQNNGHPAASCHCEDDVCSNCDLTCKPRVACEDLSYRR